MNATATTVNAQPTSPAGDDGVATALPSGAGAPAWSALARAIGKLPRLSKAGVNNHDGYRYLTIDDIVAAVRPVLSAEGLAIEVLQEAIEPTTRKKGSDKGDQELVRVTLRCSYVHGETMTRAAEGTWKAEAPDSGDKRIAIATAAALKLFLKTTLLLDAGEELPPRGGDDDPTTGRPPRRTVPRQPRNTTAEKVWDRIKAHADVVTWARVEEVQLSLGLPKVQAIKLSDDEKGRLLDELDRLAFDAGAKGGAA